MPSPPPPGWKSGCGKSGGVGPAAAASVRGWATLEASSSKSSEAAMRHMQTCVEMVRALRPSSRRAATLVLFSQCCRRFPGKRAVAAWLGFREPLFGSRLPDGCRWQQAYVDSQQEAPSEEDRPPLSASACSCKVRGRAEQCSAQRPDSSLVPERRGGESLLGETPLAVCLAWVMSCPRSLDI